MSGYLYLSAKFAEEKRVSEKSLRSPVKVICTIRYGDMESVSRTLQLIAG